MCYYSRSNSAIYDKLVVQLGMSLGIFPVVPINVPAIINPTETEQ